MYADAAYRAQLPGSQSCDVAVTRAESMPSKLNVVNKVITNYEGHLESKERFAIKKYLLIIGKKKNMQVLSHTFTYFST